MSRLNPRPRSENPPHLATFLNGSREPEPKSPCDAEQPQRKRERADHMPINPGKGFIFLFDPPGFAREDQK